ncbi:MAG: arabinose transporter permease, partial [Lachnospiraceae bacterium]|nr:arabinose transporter permease [Lachnospiraceae bacterium]
MSKFKKFFYSQKAAPYVFVLPFMLSFILFWIYPLCSTITMSFQEITPTGTNWVGFDNFTKLTKDTVFHTAILNSFEYMILTLVLLIPFPMM